jgi:hypothetical protein
MPSEQQQENDNKIIQTRFVVTAAGIMSCGARWILMGFFFYFFFFGTERVVEVFPFGSSITTWVGHGNIEATQPLCFFLSFFFLRLFFVSLSPTPLPSCQWVDPHT